MARQKKNKVAEGDRAGGRVRGIVVNGLLAAAVAGGGGYGFYRLRNHVAGSLAMPAEAPRVVMKSRPGWMDDATESAIVANAQPREARSALDAKVLEGVAERLRADGWVRQVRQVRRLYTEKAGDTIEIDCEYRAPMAVVASGRRFHLVDSHGVLLPAVEALSTIESSSQLPSIVFSNGLVNLRLIQGVRAGPPSRDGALLPGQPWRGSDLAAGLDMAKLLYGKPYTEEIHRIDVDNFGGRNAAADPQIKLITRYGTQILWGAPPNAKFHSELDPTRKMQHLADLHATRGEGNYTQVDLRPDRGIGVRRAETPIVQAPGRRNGS